MTLLEDAELLRRYADEKSEAAFAELVRRHVGPVYAFALRRVGGDAHLAEDVAQMVFTTLARKAAALAGRQVLGGWLCRTTHFAARDVVRTESRRRAREQEALIMQESSGDDAGANIDWKKLHPVIDQTLGELNDADRDAVWLRFFEGRSFAEVGARLRLTENAARMRVERALDKLHAALGRRGITSTSVALGVALANQTGVGAPAGLAATVTGAALAGAAGGISGIAAFFMSMSKTQAGIAVLLAAVGAVSLALQAQTNAELLRETTALQEQQPAIAKLRAENRQLAANLAEVELLRRDDDELKQLAQTAAELRKASEARARAAVAQPENPRTVQERKLLADDRLSKEELDRMNRAASALDEEYKQLSARARNESLSAEDREQAAEAVRKKAAAMEAKKREIQTFVQNVRRMLILRAANVHEVYPGDGSTILPPDFPTVGGPDFRRSDEVPGAAMPGAAAQKLDLPTPRGASPQLSP